jgi:hypothetical protein
MGERGFFSKKNYQNLGDFCLPKIWGFFKTAPPPTRGGGKGGEPNPPKGGLIFFLGIPPKDKGPRGKKNPPGGLKEEKKWGPWFPFFKGRWNFGTFFMGFQMDFIAGPSSL